MIGLDWLKEVKLPAIVIVGAIGAFITVYVYAETNYVRTEQYQQDRITFQIQFLEQEQRRLELDEYRLSLQCAQPRGCSAVDRAFLKKLGEDIARLKETISKLQQQRR